MAFEGTIREGIRVALRRPETGATLLAKTFAARMDGAPWVDRDMRLRFCFLFLGNLIDHGVENSVDQDLLCRVEKKSIEFGIRLLKREPEGGLRMLVALVMKQLRKEQNFGPDEQMGFYKELLARFFPEAPPPAANQ